MTNPWWVMTVAVAGPMLGALAGILIPPQGALLDRMLAFAAGTMLAISFLELLPEALLLSSPAAVAAGLAAGLCVMSLLDLTVPHLHPEKAGAGSMRRTALLMLAAISLHNLPEGIAMAAGEAGGSALLIASAIATHDIPEGICTCAPYYAATGRRAKAFWLSAATAAPTVAGYLAGRYLLHGLNPFALGTVTASTAGLMIYISCEELLPASRRGTARPQYGALALFAGIILVLLLGAVMK